VKTKKTPRPKRGGTQMHRGRAHAVAIALSRDPEALEAWLRDGERICRRKRRAVK